MNFSHEHGELLKKMETHYFSDGRGSIESYRFKESGKLAFPIVDQYIAASKVNVLRGLHVQIGDRASQKTFRVISGHAILFALCCKFDCEHFGSFEQVEMYAKNNETIFVQSLTAVGYLTLEESVIIVSSSEKYDEQSEKKVNPFSIRQIAVLAGNAEISKKDLSSPSVDDFLAGMIQN